MFLVSRMLSLRPFFFLLISFVCAFHLLSCSTNKESSSLALSSLVDRVSPNYIGPIETPYCSKVRNYSPFVTVTGRAKYEVREIFFLDETPSINNPISNIRGGLGAPSQPKPIRGAEIKVLDSYSRVVQCSKTDRQGAFSFTLPLSYETYYIFINSRANNSYAKVSVLDAPERKNPYFLYSSVHASSDKNLGTLIAAADGRILGGAFNLLDQVVNVNEFVRKMKRKALSNSSSGFPDKLIEDFYLDIENCLFSLPFPKVEIYWEPGFNPNRYYGSDEGKSFYGLNSLGRIFINGGKNGNVDSVDTDHFDSSVVIHEISHHINNFCSRIDTPIIGHHDGNSVIDPRLAWEEGSANYFQAAVRGSPNYIDTYGNREGRTGFKIYASIDYIPNSCTTSGCDVPKNESEGNFREFSVTRYLWDHQKEIPNGFFHYLSLVLSKKHFLKDEYAFRSIGLYHLNAWNSLPSGRESMRRLREKHQHMGNRKEFARRLVAKPEGTCPMPYSVQPRRVPNDNGFFTSSHLLLNNDFFHYNPSRLPPSQNIILVYKTQSGFEANLGFYLFKEFESIKKKDSLVGVSEGEPDFDLQTPEREVIDVSSLSSKSNQDYLIDVRVETGGGRGRDPGGLTRYGLRIQNYDLCPSPLDI